MLAVPDDIREEEVFACIVLHESIPDDRETADRLFDHCFGELAYFRRDFHYPRTAPRVCSTRLKNLATLMHAPSDGMYSRPISKAVWTFRTWQRSLKSPRATA